MTVDEAGEILSRLAKGEALLWRSRHSLDRLEERGYTMQDVYKIIRSRKMERAPLWDPTHENHVVRLRDKSFDGRPTELVLGLQEVGPCVFITIKDRSPRRARPK